MLNTIQQNVLAGMQREGSPPFYAGYVLKRDGRLVPLTDPAERHRSAKGDSIAVEQDDDPADVVTFVQDEKGKDTAEVASREKQPNVSAFVKVAADPKPADEK